MSRTLVRLLFLLPCLALVLPGCMLGGTRDAEDLRDLLHRYEAAVRWGDLRNTYGFLKPGTRVQIPNGLDNVRVTAYEIVSAAAPEGEGRWGQTVSIQYLHRDRQQLKTLIDRQVWVKDPDTENWYRDNPMPQYP
jgi:hypothetical protein